MLFDEPTFERYAMKTEEMSQAEQKWWVDVEEVGTQLGLDPHTSQFLAAKLDGLREIAKLRRPPWRRWLDKHPGIVAAAVSVPISISVAVAISLLVEVLKRLLWPPA